MLNGICKNPPVRRTLALSVTGHLAAAWVMSLPLWLTVGLVRQCVPGLTCKFVLSVICVHLCIVRRYHRDILLPCVLYGLHRQRAIK